MVTRLMDLKPLFRRIYRDFTPKTGGIPTDDFELSVHCPTCGPPCRICIRVGQSQDQQMLRWQGSPLPPDGEDWPDRVTISPSIDWTPSGHGKHRPPCAFHGHIVNGEIILP